MKTLPRLIVEHVISTRTNQMLIDPRARQDKNRWCRLMNHKLFINEVMEFIMYWFQVVCFFYVAVNVLHMAWEGDTEKSTNWALIALVIKPWGKPVVKV